ncbi:hypothetical protein C455_08877 [Haloferax larsenii JCM 13917]|nr:hypothetical protein C455_08877 [Haloferax larsenii JCM 13917]
MSSDSVFVAVEVFVDGVGVRPAVGTVGFEPSSATLAFVWRGRSDTGDELLIWLFGRFVVFASGELDTDHAD